MKFAKEARRHGRKLEQFGHGWTSPAETPGDRRIHTDSGMAIGIIVEDEKAKKKKK